MSEMVFEGKKIRVIRKKVTLPDGINFERDFVETENKVIVIPILSDNCFLLTKFFSPVSNSETLRFPRGGINKGETVESAALRELIEETGYKASSLKQIGSSVYPNPAWNIESWRICIARELIQTNQPKDKYESQEMVELTKKELEEAIRQGKVSDSSTISSFYVYFLN